MLNTFNHKARATQELETLKFDFFEHMDTLMATTLSNHVAFCLFNISPYEPVLYVCLFSYIMAQLQKGMEEESGGH